MGQDNYEARKLLTESIAGKQTKIDTLNKEAEGFHRRAQVRINSAGFLDEEIHGLEVALEGLGGRLDDE